MYLLTCFLFTLHQRICNWCCKQDGTNLTLKSYLTVVCCWVFVCFFCLWLTILSIYKWCSIQVASIIRRLLPEVSPAHFAKLTGVTTLPANDLSILTQSSDKLSDSRLEDSVGILDIFLACICKALTVQSKVKGGGGKIPGLEGRGTQSLTLAKLLQM